MNTLCENIKNMKGISPAVDVRNDLIYKTEYVINSYFAIGHFEAKEHTLNYLFHIITMDSPGKELMGAMFSVTDETTKEYYSDVKVCPIDSNSISTDRFFLKAPNGKMCGDIDLINISAEMDRAKLDIEIRPEGYPIFNGGTGRFHLANLDIYQYSIPHAKTVGTLTLNDEIYDVDCMTWFDRQWEMPNPKMPIPVKKALGWFVNIFTDGGKKMKVPSWGWMDINLDNGDVMSVWFEAGPKGEDCWATVMHPDGTQKKVFLNPIVAQAEDWWKSPDSDYAYPMKYHVQCPELDADLIVLCNPKEQELVFEEFPTLSHYEGASQVSGVYKGKNVTGYCYVENIGFWDESMLNHHK